MHATADRQRLASRHRGTLQSRLPVTAQQSKHRRAGNEPGRGGDNGLHRRRRRPDWQAFSGARVERRLMVLDELTVEHLDLVELLVELAAHRVIGMHSLMVTARPALST